MEQEVVEKMQPGGGFPFTEETMDWMEKKSKEMEKLMSYYRCAMMEIETKLLVLNEEFSF